MLHVRLTDETMKALEEEGEKRGLKPSTLVRMVMMDWLRESRDGTQRSDRQP